MANRKVACFPEDSLSSTLLSGTYLYLPRSSPLLHSVHFLFTQSLPLLLNEFSECHLPSTANNSSTSNCSLALHSDPLTCSSFIPARALSVLSTIILRIIAQLFMHLPVSQFYCLSAFIAGIVYNREVRARQLKIYKNLLSQYTMRNSTVQTKLPHLLPR